MKTEAAKAIRYTDYSRIRNYDLEELFQEELTTLPFHLSINGDFHILENESELERIIESKLESTPSYSNKWKCEFDNYLWH